MGNSRPGDGGFQVNEDYTTQLTDISTDFNNAVVAFSSAAAVKGVIDTCFNTLSNHDFSAAKTAIKNICDINNDMLSEVQSMSLEFQALISGLEELDRFILEKLGGLNLTDTEKDGIRKEYEKYKNGQQDFSDFLNYLAGLRNEDLIADMFGVPDELREGFKIFFAESGKYIGGKFLEKLEQYFVDSSLIQLTQAWGLNLQLDAFAYGSSQGVAYSISTSIYNIIKNMLSSEEGAFAEKHLADLADFTSSAFGGFFLSAALISLFNVGMYAVQGDLDFENFVRSVGDGTVIALSTTISSQIVELLAAGSVPGLREIIAGAVVVSLVYYGGSKLVDYLADQIWSDEIMNFDHERLIEELKENGYIIMETNKIDGLDENIIQTYLRMEDEGAPRALTNFLLGASGLPYDTSLDNSIEFDAVLYLYDGSKSVLPGEYTDKDIQDYAKMLYPNSEDQEKFIAIATEIRDYFNNNRTEETGVVREYIGQATIDYTRYGGSFFET